MCLGFLKKGKQIGTITGMAYYYLGSILIPVCTANALQLHEADKKCLQISVVSCQVGFQNKDRWQRIISNSFS